jgi:hypothetical protein
MTMAQRWDRRIYGQGGGYGQTGPGLNFGEEPMPGFDSAPYRVPISREGGGFHAGSYEAEHYREFSEREPGSRHDQYEFDRGDKALNTGHRAVDHRGKGPRNYRRADRRIEEDVSERLMADHWVDATDIRVTVADGEVTLNGTVDSRNAKHRAEEMTETISGVRHVQNNLRVSLTNVNYRPPSPLEGAQRPRSRSEDTGERGRAHGEIPRDADGHRG